MRRRDYNVRGKVAQVMGNFYSIKIVSRPSAKISSIKLTDSSLCKLRIEDELESVNLLHLEGA